MGSKRLEGEEERRLDRISLLPDGVLGDIVSLLPTKEGARTQVISSRWRRLWCSAPLNFDLRSCTDMGKPIHSSEIPRILSAHRGPGRRFCVPMYLFLQLQRKEEEDSIGAATTLDGWLRSPALNNLQELDFYLAYLPPPLPASVHRFSSTLRIASFGGCGFPPDSALHLPHLEQLTLNQVTISETSFHALLVGCPVLQSLLLSKNSGCSQLRVVSRTLRSISVRPGYCMLQHLILEDAPSLERLFLFSVSNTKAFHIKVISAPKLDILGPLSNHHPTLHFGTTVFKGSRLVRLTTVVPSVKVLTLVHAQLSLDAVINFMRCFPCLEKLYMKVETILSEKKNLSSQKYRNLGGTLRIKKIVLRNYRDNKSHANFVRFFVLNAKVLDSMILELEDGNLLSKGWVEKQHALLRIKNRASMGAHIDFVYRAWRPPTLRCVGDKIAHDLSTAEPFERFREWSI